MRKAVFIFSANIYLRRCCLVTLPSFAITILTTNEASHRNCPSNQFSFPLCILSPPLRLLVSCLFFFLLFFHPPPFCFASSHRSRVWANRGHLSSYASCRSTHGQHTFSHRIARPGKERGLHFFKVLSFPAWRRR